MNERIKELADKAQEYAEWMTPQGLEWFDNFKEQFAELIIEECAKISESVTPRHTECGNKIAAKIRQFHGDKDEMV
jgi:uncharacterized coiled-coil DUF342 family protein